MNSMMKASSILKNRDNASLHRHRWREEAEVTAVSEADRTRNPTATAYVVRLRDYYRGLYPRRQRGAEAVRAREREGVVRDPSCQTKTIASFDSIYN